jgi:hypothetical protein
MNRLIPACSRTKSGHVRSGERTPVVCGASSWNSAVHAAARRLRLLLLRASVAARGSKKGQRDENVFLHGAKSDYKEQSELEDMEDSENRTCRHNLVGRRTNK